MGGARDGSQNAGGFAETLRRQQFTIKPEIQSFIMAAMKAAKKS